MPSGNPDIDTCLADLAMSCASLTFKTPATLATIRTRLTWPKSVRETAVSFVAGDTWGRFYKSVSALIYGKNFKKAKCDVAICKY
jgi:hypothetical protein